MPPIRRETRTIRQVSKIPSLEDVKKYHKKCEDALRPYGLFGKPQEGSGPNTVRLFSVYRDAVQRMFIDDNPEITEYAQGKKNVFLLIDDGSQNPEPEEVAEDFIPPVAYMTSRKLLCYGKYQLIGMYTAKTKIFVWADLLMSAHIDETHRLRDFHTKASIQKNKYGSQHARISGIEYQNAVQMATWASMILDGKGIVIRTEKQNIKKSEEEKPKQDKTKHLPYNHPERIARREELKEKKKNAKLGKEETEEITIVMFYMVQEVHYPIGPLKIEQTHPGTKRWREVTEALQKEVLDMIEEKKQVAAKRKEIVNQKMLEKHPVLAQKIAENKKNEEKNKEFSGSESESEEIAAPKPPVGTPNDDTGAELLAANLSRMAIEEKILEERKRREAHEAHEAEQTENME
jgi:hypothetical protein